MKLDDIAVTFRVEDCLDRAVSIRRPQLAACVTAIMYSSRRGFRLNQVLAVVTQTILRNLNRVEITVRPPLDRYRHTCVARK